MIAGVMRLGDLPVGAVMTPRHEVTMINLSEPDEAIRFAFRNSTHSRLPVFDGEETLGIIQSKDMLDAYLAGEAPTSAS
jgi:putative hemolysin